jgi:hypothetical protein
MPESIIPLQVHQPGARADEILASLAEHLHLEVIRPEASGRAELRRQTDGAEAYEDVRSALDGTAPDWGRYLLVHKPLR